MAYRVRIEAFEGPFDLLLRLVAKQKVAIAELSIAEIADQYLEHLERMEDLDLDVASDFLLVAATLLELKAASLLPRDEPVLAPEFEDMTPEEARELLIARLLAYKQFKNAAGELAARYESESRTHARAAGLEESFLQLMPDYLEGVTLHGLAVVCADLVHRREVFLLEADHVASAPISLELHVEGVARTITARRRATFRELVARGAPVEELVVTFLAILELYKRGLVELVQDAEFGDIEIVRAGDDA
ncbi:MAG: segregation/condensation protein A [Aeromicrobium sp.]|jgi:segregation and condensation protein A|nr:segregation/condensation protein A [Aeromicrobium sp.]